MQQRKLSLAFAIVIAATCPQLSKADVTDAICLEQAHVGGAPGTILVPVGLDPVDFCSKLVPSQIEPGICQETAVGSGKVCHTPSLITVSHVPLWKMELRSDERGYYCVPSYKTSLAINIKVGDGCRTLTP
jgi:hypothetical protein